jgi:hypothetical protein
MTPRGQEHGIAEDDLALALDHPGAPLPVGLSRKSGDVGAFRARAPSPPRTIASASGCSLPRSTLAARRSRSSSANPAAGTMAVTAFGLPSVSVPVLSTTSVSTFSIRSSASAFLIRTPACAPRPTPTMIDIGVARPSAQGQAMMSTETAATRPIGEARLRTPDAQAKRRAIATRITSGTNQPET